MKTEHEKVLINTTSGKKDRVLKVLKVLTQDNRQNPLSWPKTREVADVCDDSVYVVRYWLGLLEKEGRVCSTNGNQGGRGNALRWCPKSVP